MVSRTLNIVAALIGLVLVGTFVIGLTHSISKGSSGFLNSGGGVVIAIIVGAVLLCVVYDLYDSAVRKKK